MVEHVPLEPHATIAMWDANGRVTIYSTLGRITLGRADVARTLGIPMSRIRIVATIVGGNFGGKNEITTEPAARAALEEDRAAGEVRLHPRPRSSSPPPRAIR